MVKNPDNFVPGHTACAGCGCAIAMRQIVNALGKDIIIVNATGCMEIVSSCYPRSAWNVPYIHVLFENVPAVASGIVNALRAKGNDHTTVVCVGGDGATYDIGFGSLSGMLERNEDVLYICYDNEAYMNCLSGSTLVHTEEGLKKITEIKVGENVYAFDQKNHKPVLKKCTGVFDNGEKPIFEVETLHHNIKATGNHPFLTVQRNGRGEEAGLKWRMLEQLKEGDEVIVLKKMEGQQSRMLNIEKYPSQYKHQNFLVGNDWFEVEKIRRIKPAGVEQTWDLRVDGEHNFIADGIVVHNTGIQRSSSTPLHASTTTSQAGSVVHGKTQWKKPIVEIVAAHRIPYAASTSISFFADVEKKLKKAQAIRGSRFVAIHASCNPGWRHEADLTYDVCKLAVETGMWKLCEYENNEFKLNYKPAKLKPVEEYLKLQGRFKHLTKEEIEEIQKHIEEEWKKL